MRRQSNGKKKAWQSSGRGSRCWRRHRPLVSTVCCAFGRDGICNCRPGWSLCTWQVSEPVLCHRMGMVGLKETLKITKFQPHAVGWLPSHQIRLPNPTWPWAPPGMGHPQLHDSMVFGFLQLSWAGPASCSWYRRQPYQRRLPRKQDSRWNQLHCQVQNSSAAR